MYLLINAFCLSVYHFDICRYFHVLAATAASAIAKQLWRHHCQVSLRFRVWRELH